MKFVQGNDVKGVIWYYPFAGGKKLLSGQNIDKNTSLELEAWGFKIVEEQ
ncbi:MAG: hypothetical protein V4722_02925 [Bacteroidota bacterium]